ncbi:malonate decarboxylase holo-[acyl-carrier-protein] synthase [Sphingomonas populi]|uniref:Malonate decarboxylase holo-[acyl-carrier-protein] synthase n=1 Tax=Sphingomonas populi TaxID=2484750 RepID=A0A4Q6XUE9_9SPHN|nr:malonate decarboxylase holo-[acyl-carrier-protein] synthase [Sphingomonas populi]RZF61114.1 malonate decarboxylase holo-[acyl-carrier-protein] synthase [Sphingomonas populi]
MRLDRHRLVHLDPSRWPDVLAAHPASRDIPEVAGWAAAGWPLIARRPLCDDKAGFVPLGLPLPPSLGKRRLAFAVPPDAILSDGPPPLLADAAEQAPMEWRQTIAKIVALDPETRCFGSLAWMHLTGLAYLSLTSDLDLLWHVADADDTARLAPILEVDITAPMRLDGEFITPSGYAIQWREWMSEASEVLVKTTDGNRMLTRAAVFA